MADRMCCWANCDNETVAITVTIKGNPAERLVFCCLDHASNKLAAMTARKHALRTYREDAK
jgi:hypothetical protein